MEKIQLGLLNGIYGPLLNNHQREVLQLYFDNDMSLAEVAEEQGITRQAVRDIIARSSSKLKQYEEKLGFSELYFKLIGDLESMLNRFDILSKEDIKKEINIMKEFLKGE